MALAIKTAEHSVFVMLDLHTETCGRATTSASMRSGQCEGEKSTFELWTFVVHSCDMLPSRASTSAFLAATHFHVSCRMGRKSLFNREGMTARQCTPIVVQGTGRSASAVRRPGANPVLWSRVQVDRPNRALERLHRMAGLKKTSYSIALKPQHANYSSV